MKLPTTVYRAMLGAYCVLLLWGTLSPFDFSRTIPAGAWDEGIPEWVPFAYFCPECGWRGYVQDKVVNLAMFVPFGALLYLSLDTGSVSRAYTARVFMVSLACSLAIECMQAFLPSRSPMASDVVMNGVGGAAGAWFTCQIRRQLL